MKKRISAFFLGILALSFMPHSLFSMVKFGVKGTSPTTVYLGEPKDDLYTFIGLKGYPQQRKKAQKDALTKADAAPSKSDKSKTYGQLISDLKGSVDKASKAYDFAIEEYDIALKTYNDYRERKDKIIYIDFEQNKETLRKKFERAKTDREKSKQELDEFRIELQKVVAERDALAGTYIVVDESFNRWAKDNIEEACKKTNSELRKERSAIKKELQNFQLSTFAQQQKKKRLSEIEEKLQKMVNVCPLLLNTKSRKAYDDQLFAAERPDVDPYQSVQDAIYKATLFTPDRKVLLNDLVGLVLSKIKLPPIAIKVLRTEISNVHFLKRPSGEDVRYGLGFGGTIKFFGIETNLTMFFVRDIYGKDQVTIIVGLPMNFKMSDLDSKLSKFDWIRLPSAKLMISTFNLKAEELKARKGITVESEWRVFEGPLTFLNKLQESKNKLKGLVFEPDPIKVSIFVDPTNIMQTKASLKIPMKLGVDFRNIGVVPNWFSKVVNRITTKEFKISIEPSGRVKDPELDDRIEDLREWRVKQRKAVIRAKKEWEEALQGGYPPKVAQKLKEKYESENKKYQNFIRQAQLAVGEKESIEEEYKAAQEVKKGKFDISEVVKEKAQEKLDLSIVPKGYKHEEQAWKDRLGQALKLGIAGFQMDLSASAEIILGTQKDPLITEMRGSIIPVSPRHPNGFVSLIASLKNMIEFKWLAIGNVKIGLDWDLALLPAATALGVPLTGIGIKGQIDLGKPGASRASLDAMGGISLVTTGVPDFLFEVTASNIRLSDLVNYSLYLATKAGFEKASGLIDKIPTISFEKIWGYAAAGEATILGKAITPGVGVEVRTVLFDYPFGGKLFVGGTDKGYQLSGYAYGPRIEWKDRIKLYGETEDKSPEVSFDFNPKKPLDGKFTLDGTVVIPPIGLKAKTKFNWSGRTIDAEFNSEWANMMVMFGITMNPYAGDIKETLHESRIRMIWETLRKKDLDDPLARAVVTLLNDDIAQLQDEKRIYDADIYARIILGKLSNIPKVKPLEEKIISKAKDILEEKKRQLTTPGYELWKKIRSGQKVSLGTKATLEYLFMKLDGLIEITKTLLIKISGVRSAPSFQKRATEIINQIKLIRSQQLTNFMNALSDSAAQIRIRRVVEEEISRLEALYGRLADISGKDVARAEPEGRFTLPEQERKTQDLKRRTEKVVSMAKQASPISAKVVSKAGMMARKLFAKEEQAQGLDVKTDKTIDPTAKWRGLQVRFGFTGEFSKFLSEHAIPFLKEQKEKALRKLDEFTDWVAKKQAQGMEVSQADIDRNQKKIDDMNTELEKLRAECNVTSGLKRISCEAGIKSIQSKLIYRKKLKDTYLKVKRKVITKSAQAVRATVQSRYVRGVLEKILDVTNLALEKALKGLTIVEVLEAAGAYSYEDMKSFRLPQLVSLVVRENYTGQDITMSLGPLQFDFKSPIKTGREIFSSIFSQVVGNIKKLAAFGLQKAMGVAGKAPKEEVEVPVGKQLPSPMQPAIPEGSMPELPTTAGAA